MHIRYRVDLEEGEPEHLEAIVAGGTRAVLRVRRARFSSRPQRACPMPRRRVAAGGTSTVYRTKQDFVDCELDRALSGAYGAAEHESRS